MPIVLPRRRFLACAGTTALLPASLVRAAETPMASGPDRPYIPAQDPEVVRQIVGASHGNIAVVRELIDRQPALVNAGHDWGFGDWESPIDAASHVGNTEIALLLIERGARPTIFTLAMLGHLDALKAAIGAFPEVQQTRGPHGITLMAHAKAGGDQATIDYLESLGDADPVYPGARLTPETAGPYLGVYAYGPHETERFELADEKERINFRRTGGVNRFLFAFDPAAPHTFHPAGAPAVRITFRMQEGRAVGMTIADPDVYITAERVAGM